MLIVILSLSKTKEFVKYFLYELFYPKGAYLTAKGTKYCRNCSHNSIQFASRTIMFVETCRNLRRKLWQDSTERFVQSARLNPHPLPDTFLLMLIKRVWMRLISLIADSLVCPDTLKSLSDKIVPHVAEVQMCRCDALSRVLWHFVILCEYFMHLKV